MPNNLFNNRGLTLLDLIVAVAVLSLLARAGYILFSGLENSFAEKRAIKELQILLDCSALRAVITGHEQIVLLKERMFVAFDSAPQPDKPEHLTEISRLTLPKTLSPSVFRFAASRYSSKGAALVLRTDSSATPGMLVLKNPAGKECSITQGLRGLRTLRCQA